MVPTLDLQSNEEQVKTTIIIIVVFCLIYYLCFLLEGPFNSFLSQHLTIRSEYTVTEQLSKFYLFIVLLLSVFSYQVLHKSTQIKLTISFILLSVILYMSESNMIHELAQPIFGLIIVACTGMLLLRERFRLSLILFIVGFTLISGGSLIDLVHKYESMCPVLPPFLFDMLHIVSEERFEVTGTAFLCLSALLCFRVPLQEFIANNTKASLLLLLASGMITMGNGFIHYQYKPGWMLYLFALVMTMTGFFGLIIINRRVSKQNALLTLITEELFYIFLFVFFVLLPSIHGTARSSTAVFLWLPVMFFAAFYLWRSHPRLHTETIEQ